MAFRPRNVALNRADVVKTQPSSVTDGLTASKPGVKPSFLSTHNITSTGTAELDGLLGGHGGLLLGSSLLIGEHGTTDYSGALLRAYAAEGVLQGHHVHVIAVGKPWTQNLPGVASNKDKKNTSSNDDERMKIAWRYETMERASSRGITRNQADRLGAATSSVPFCHTFDLTKRMDLAPEHKLHHITLGNEQDPFEAVLMKLANALSTESKAVHRVVIASLLSPLHYPLTTSSITQTLRFMHGLRALLRRHPTQLTIMISVPLSLYPRSLAVTRWMEHLSDGALELVPFPFTVDTGTSKEDAAQGMLKVLKLPIATERGEGGAGSGNTIGDDLAFTLSRRKFVIEPFSLPPVEGDQEAQQEAGKITAKAVDF